MLATMLILTLFIALQGWAHSSAVTQAVQKLESHSQCQDLESFFWSETHQLILENTMGLDWQKLKAAFQNSEAERVQNLSYAFDLFQKHLTSSFFKLEKSQQLEIWSQLELGIDTSAQLGPLIKDLKNLMENLKQKNLKNCIQPFQAPRASVNLSEGAKKVMSVIYQSCEAVKLAPLDDQAAYMEGVSVIGDHSDGVGKVRKIASLPLVQKTHPYLRIQNNESGCFPVNDKPVIYDYGGKPSYRSAAGFEIDLFKNAGSGGRELGLDCSALVVASLGIQGLRLKPNEDMTARNTAAFGTATLIKSPDYFPCLDYVTIGKNEAPLLPGDIVTVQGHTLIIDETGQDPMGLSSVTNEKACSQISVDQMDFKVLHSSPGWGSVGIARMEGRDYLKTSTKMRAGILKYARNHCVLNFQNKILKPKYTDVSITRHGKTTECLGKSLTLNHQSCVRS